MITKTRIYTSDTTDPYRNLAVEEHLLGLVEEGECILYLWQNRQTVVIGRNQNAFKECKTEKLKADGGFLARRLSGGGSVYHDLGNLNFTFLVREGDYQVDRQLSVIVRALEAFGLSAQKTGRNDICIDGRKFSGNAFYKHRGRCYHHGTLLVDVDLHKMSEYLHVSAEKLKAHSVSSVQSRVVNLGALSAGLTIATLQAALKEAFGALYAQPQVIAHGDLDRRAVGELTEKYASDEWRYGKHMKADYTAGHKFPWGEISVLLQIKGDLIQEAQVFTDAMDERISQVVSACLKGTRFHGEAMAGALEQARGTLAEDVRGDIADLLKKQEIW